MKASHAALACLLIFANGATAIARPPPGKGRGRSPAKWDIKGMESDLRELEKLTRRARWGESNFLTLYRNYLLSARKRLEAIKLRDPSWPTAEYEQRIERFQRAYDRHTGRPERRPPQRTLSAAEKSIVDRIADRSVDLAPGRLLVSGSSGWFDDENHVRAFADAALRADYRHERGQLENDLGRVPHLRSHPTIAAFLDFQQKFSAQLDRLVLPEIGRLLDIAYANRARNKPFGISKARAALDLLAAVRLVTDHPRLAALEKQGRTNMNELARGVYPTGFHAENAGRVVVARAPIRIGRESRFDLLRRVSAGQRLYAAAYFEKPLDQIAPPGSTILLDTRIILDGREIGSSTKRLVPSEAVAFVVELPLVPAKAEVTDDRPATITKILSNVPAGRHLLKVVATVRAEGRSFARDAAEGTVLLFANAGGLQAWSRMAAELIPAPPPPPPVAFQRAKPVLVGPAGQRPPPPPPPPRYTPPPPPAHDPGLQNVELPAEKVRNAGLRREAIAAIQKRYGKTPLKVGFFTHWNKGELNGNKFRKITVWVVWPDHDRDGVAEIESYELIAHWNRSRWSPLQVVGPAPGPRHRILVSKVR